MVWLHADFAGLKWRSPEGSIVKIQQSIAEVDPSLARFYDALDAPDAASAQTVYACHRDLSEFSAFMAHRGKRVSAANPGDIAGFLHKIQGLPGSIRRLRSIRLYFRFLIHQGLVLTDPVADVIVPGSLPHFSVFEHRAIKIPIALLGVFVLNTFLYVPLPAAVGIMAAGWILAVLALPVNPNDHTPDNLTWSA